MGVNYSSQKIIAEDKAMVRQLSSRLKPPSKPCNPSVHCRSRRRWHAGSDEDSGWAVQAQHFRSTKEPSDKFQIPITSAMEVAFHPAQPGDAYFHPPMFGRKACDVTVIEEYQIMGPRMP
jgi:hypothetical protein